MIRASYVIVFLEQHYSNSLTHSDVFDNHLKYDWSADEENVQLITPGEA